MKHLITGSKGFIGQHLMRALGDDAVGVDLPDFDVTAVARSGMPQIYRAFPQLTRIETVWHLAAINDATQTFYDRPWDVLNTQIRGTLNVIDACVANGVKTLVLFSSSEVYQTPPVIPTPEGVPLVVPDLKNPRYSYGGGKIAAELLAWWSAIPRVIIIRPHNVYSGTQRPGHVIADFVRKIDALGPDEPFAFRGPRNDTRSFCYIDDFTAALLRIVEHHSGDEKTREVYHVGTEEEVTIEGLAVMIGQLWGRDGLYIGGQGAAPSGGTRRRCPDTRKLRALGWEPKVSLREGLAKTIAWYREQKK